MKDVKSPASRALDVVAREAEADLVPRDLDWAKMEASLMARVAKEPAPVSPNASARERVLRLGRVAVVGLAAAAAIALVVKTETARKAPETATISADPAAGALRTPEATGDIRVGGRAAVGGQVLHQGDVLETDGERAILERDQRATWILEKNDLAHSGSAARVRVKSAGDSLVLGLESGAIEAQVVPAPAGEAFAVDVSSKDKTVRVAAHGTHLRVARDESAHVTVDLNEGAVSIGTPPRTGSTYGTLVTAPAHVELDVNDVDGSMRIDHTLASVRSPASLGPAPVAAAASASKGSKSAGVMVNPAAAPAGAPTSPRAASPAAKATTGGKADPTAMATTAHNRGAIAAAVRDCAVKKGRPAFCGNSPTCLVSSTLQLRVSPAGDVEAARFDPPLEPEIQTCAASTIFGGALDETGQVSIKIDFSY